MMTFEIIAQECMRRSEQRTLPSGEGEFHEAL